MNRNLRTLVLCVVAAFAFSAMVASSASAWFTWEPEVENRVTTAKALTPQSFENAKFKVSCEAIAFDEGKVFGAEITAKPTYSGCTYTEGGTTLSATIEFTSCTYMFHTERKIGLEIECPAGVEAHIFVKFLGTNQKCLTIPAQHPTQPKVDYFNSGTKTEMDIKLLSTVQGIEYTKQGICGEGVANDITYTGEMTVTAETATKEPLSLTWDEHAEE